MSLTFSPPSPERENTSPTRRRFPAPKGTLTRAQFAVILARLLDPAQRVSAEG